MKGTTFMLPHDIINNTTNSQTQGSKMNKTTLEQRTTHDLTVDTPTPEAQGTDVPDLELPELQVKDEPDTASRNMTSPRASIKKEPRLDVVKTSQGEPEALDDDMFEDVDDDDVVDLTYEGIAHVNGVRHFVCEGFKIRQIPEPFIVKRSLIDLNRCIEAKSIVLDPDYQREVVWDEGRAALLITSILMGYFIPPIIFNVKKKVVKSEGGRQEKYTRICVDGKQRLTSIWKFMKGQIGFFDTSTPQKKWYYCHQIIDGHIQIMNRNILPNAVKKFFENHLLVCYEYEELTLDIEETMFQLVQRGIALTPAEKMRAMSTEWATFTKQYEDDYSLIVNLSKQNRASGFRLILTIFTMIQEVMAGRKKRFTNTITPTLQASPQALMRVLDDKSSVNPALKLKFKAIFDRYEGLVKLSSTQITATKFKINPNSVFDPAPEFLRDAGVSHVRTFSPLELVVSAILVTVHMDQCSDEEMLEDIKAMRGYLRAKHKDLRVNAQCWATSWTYITDETAKKRASKTFDINHETGESSSSLLASIEGGKSGGLSSSSTRGSSGGEGTDGDSSPLSSAPTSDEEIEEVPEVTKRKLRKRIIISDSDEEIAMPKKISKPAEKLKDKGKAKRMRSTRNGELMTSPRKKGRQIT